MLFIFVFPFVCFAIAFAMAPPEGVNLLHPDIDTQFTSGYSEANFKRIQKDMTKNEVVQLLGDPYSIQKIEDDLEQWEFTSDGASKQGDFAWKGRVVIFKNNRVVETNSSWRFD